MTALEETRTELGAAWQGDRTSQQCVQMAQRSVPSLANDPVANKSASEEVIAISRG
jgi:hypothetical protein